MVAQDVKAARLTPTELAECEQFWSGLGQRHYSTYNPAKDLPKDAPYEPWSGRGPRQRALPLAALTARAEAQRAQRELRLRLIAHFGGRCKDCGVVGPPAIYQFDHLDPFAKSCNVSKLRTWEAALAEAEKCDLVCCNCHAIRTEAGKERIQAAARARRSARRLDG